MGDESEYTPSKTTANVIEIPYTTPQHSLAMQSRRAPAVRQALVASNLVNCTVESWMTAIDENAGKWEEGESAVDKEVFISTLRLLPTLRTGEAFQPVEETLDRIYQSFLTADRGDRYQLAIACLPLLHGSMRKKVRAALRLCLQSSDENSEADSRVAASALTTALTDLLLSITAIFDLESSNVTEEEEESKSTEEDLSKPAADVIAECVQEVVEQLYRDNELEPDATADFEEHVWPWMEKNEASAIPWLKLVDHSKWPMTRRFTKPASKASNASPPPSSHEDENGEEEEGEQAGLSFQFSSVEGGDVSIGPEQADILYDLLLQSALTKLTPMTMYETFVCHTDDGLLEADTFIDAVEELISMTGVPHLIHDNTFLDIIIEIFRSYLTKDGVKVDAYEVAAGFSLFAWGSKSDKLGAAFHYFDAESKGHLDRAQFWRFLRSVLIMLLYLSPPDEAAVSTYGSIVELVDTGEEDIMNIVMCELEDEEDEAENEDAGKDKEALEPMHEFAFEDFGEWYNAGGFTAMSWLELLDLRKWIFVTPDFDVDGLDVQAVDPAVASTRYYTMNNIQVDVDAESETNSFTAGDNTFTYGHVIKEMDDEDDLESSDTSSKVREKAGLSHSSSSANLSRAGSNVGSTMPAIVLKNEIVLEFDLPFDTTDDSVSELPLTTLSFDNGDLIVYSELQRVTRLRQVELFRLYDTFDPYMAPGAPPYIDKSTFNTCISKLLPRDVSPGVAKAFSVHANTRIPPRTVGRGEDDKMVADTLTRLFFAFNRGGMGQIDLVEFLSAFTMFCAGSKSEKLAFAYRLFDNDRDGCLSLREMWKYLRSFLTMMLALGNGSDLSAEAIASVADTTSIGITNAIFIDLQKNTGRSSGDGNGRRHPRSLSDDGLDQSDGNSGVVSFEEFARWYSTDGFNIIAWVELLDSKKWPEVDPQVSDVILKYIWRQQQAIANAAQRTSDPESTSSNDTVSSNESGRRERNSSLDNSYPETVRSNLEDNETGVEHLAPSSQRLSSSAKDLSSVALQFQLTSYDNMVLRIRLKDVAIVYTISERMNFSAMSINKLKKLLDEHAHGRMLTKTGFLRAMRQMVPREELTNDDQEFLSFHLMRVFTLFESETLLEEEEEDGQRQVNSMASSNGMSTVQKLLLTTGLSIFCGTTKSAKLSALFKLFDPQRSGFVSRRQLFEMLKSILVVLFAFSSYSASKTHSNDTSTSNSWSTNSAAEKAAGAVVSKLFSEARSKHSDAVSLSEFASWYAAGGYMDCPWLELLDLSKWPAKEAFEASKREKPLMYAFEMADEGSILNFTEHDIANYLSVVTSTKLRELSVNKVYDALLAYATPSPEEVRKRSMAEDPSASGLSQAYSYAAVEEDEGAYLEITRSNFYACIRSLVPKQHMPEKSQKAASKLLTRLFNVFDRKGAGRVNALELACGMSIVGKGSKSQKLSMAFDFIMRMRQQRRRTLGQFTTNLGGVDSTAPGVQSSTNTGTATGFGFPVTNGLVASSNYATATRRTNAQNDDMNALPHSVLFIYLRSFLLALMALSDGTYRLGLEKIYVEADDFIEEAMGDLMTDVTNQGPNNPPTSSSNLAGFGSARSRVQVTFEQFGEWYNNGGFQLISWVELLDVEKWAQEAQMDQTNSTASAAPPTAGSVYSRHMPVMGSQRTNMSVTASTQAIEPLKTTSYRSKQPSTRRKQVRRSDIVLAPKEGEGGHESESDGHRTKERRESLDDMGLNTEGPVMVFAIAPDAAELQFFHEDINRLRVFMAHTQLHNISALHLSGALSQALDVDVSSSALSLAPVGTFMDAVEQLCAASSETGYLTNESEDLLQSLLAVFARESGEEEEDDQVDVVSAICGLMVICSGTIIEKLKCGAQMLEDDLDENAVIVKMGTLRALLSSFLMAFYGISSSLSPEIVRSSADLGARDVLQAFENVESPSSSTDMATFEEDVKPAMDDADWQRKISLKEFSDWFSESGNYSLPWLELAELERWPPAINVCGTDVSTGV